MLKKTWIKSILIMIVVLVGLIGYWLLPSSAPSPPIAVEISAQALSAA